MKYQISISCNTENLSRIRHFVEAALLRHAVDEMEVHKLVLAVDEVVANLIIHANHSDETHKIELVVDLIPEKEVIFIIKDQGIYFDFTHYQEPSIDEVVSSRRKGGVGLMLVKRIMDKIEFSTEKNYNICRLTRKFRS